MNCTLPCPANIQLVSCEGPVSLQPLSNNNMFILQDSLPEKLAIYEKNIDEFDAFVDTLQ